MTVIVCPPRETAATLESVVRRIDEISTLPHVALRMIQVADDPESGAADLKEVMESDVALSAKVLRCVNSSAYGVRVQVTNLQQAIAYLGMKQIRNLAVTIGVSELFKQQGEIGPYRRSGLWRHMVATGICARMIALRLKFSNFEDVFLAGLLHDLGIILEDQYDHERFVRVIQSLGEAETLAAAENRQLGFDHAILGEQLAIRWGFPESARAAIRYHHASMNYRGEYVNVVRCVEAANLICTLKGMSSVGYKLVKFSRAAFAGLSLAKQDIAILAEDLDKELSAQADLFAV